MGSCGRGSRGLFRRFLTVKDGTIAAMVALGPTVLLGGAVPDRTDGRVQRQQRPLRGDHRSRRERRRRHHPMGPETGGMTGEVPEPSNSGSLDRYRPRRSWLRATLTGCLIAALGNPVRSGGPRRTSGYGYKPKIRASRTTSALHPAPEIRTLNFRSWRHCGPNLTRLERSLLTHSRHSHLSGHCRQTGQSRCCDTRRIGAGISQERPQ